MKARSQVVCVVGMHRSGTSVVTSLLEALGVHLGDTGDLLATLPENPRGYWEHRGIKDLNEALLARLGGRWHTPPSLPPGWEHSPALEDLRAQARAIVDDGFGERELWGWKDPRTCLTLPFWRPLLPDTDPRFVLCLRNPVDVARSLRARDDLPLAHGLRLWLTYTAAALAHTAGHSRLLLFYEDVVRDPECAAAALARYIGRPPLPSDTAGGLVVPELRHHFTPPLDTIADHTLPYPVRSLELILRSLQPRTREMRARDAAADADVDACLDAAAAAALEAQGALDAASGASTWLADDLRAARQARLKVHEACARAAGESDPARLAVIFEELRAVLPQPQAVASSAASNGTNGTRTMLSPLAVATRMRCRGRQYLARHQAQGIAYRRVRRVVRRWLGLGP